MDKNENEKWAKHYEKVKAVTVRSRELIQEVGKANIQTQVSRFIAVNDKSTKMLSPIEGYQLVPLMSLEEALVPLAHIIPELEEKIWEAKQKCKNPKDQLTQDESASIMIYTMEWEPHELCLYRLLNLDLRSEARNALKKWFPFLKLILTALYKLPSFKGTAWRGIPGFNKQYNAGENHTWWSFSSAIINMSFLESCVRHDGERTMISIDCKHGKRLGSHSYFTNEDEILFMPGFHFQVMNQSNPAPGLCIISLKEKQLPFQLLRPPF